MSAVWGTIRDALKAAAYTDFNAMPFERESAMLDAMAADLEAKLTLLTPAHAAVIALVNRLYEHHACIKGMGNEERLNCWDDLMQAAATLREQEAET